MASLYEEPAPNARHTIMPVVALQIVPVVKRVDEGLKRHRLCTARLAGGQWNFLCGIKRKGWLGDEKKRGHGPTNMVGVQLLISENDAASWRMNGRSKGIACTNILPPVQKSAEFEKRSL